MGGVQMGPRELHALLTYLNTTLNLSYLTLNVLLTYS